MISCAVKCWLITIAVLVAGCATPVQTFYKEGATAQENEAVRRECAYEATKAQAQHSNVFIGNEAGDRVYRACFMAKGYR